MRKTLITIISASTLLLSCKGGGASEVKDADLKETVVEKVEEQSAICLIDNLSIRETPSKKGKWLAAMSLGEKVTYTGEEILDSVSKKQFCKVKLIDGKEGWTRASLMGINAEVGVMKDEVVVYKRPDLSTITEKKYSPMDIVAILDQKEEWIHVKGKRTEGEYIEEGWIKSSNISKTSADIAVARLAGIAMNKSSMTERINALQKITSNSDMSESSFIPLIEEKIALYQEKNQPLNVEEATDGEL